MAERIAIIGAGRMGVPMAQVLSAAGYTVDIVDLKDRPEQAFAQLQAQSRAEIAANVELLKEEGMAGDGYLDDVLSRIQYHQGMGPYLAAADCAFDALPERLDVKEPAFRELGQWLRPDCVVGSTTSTLPANVLAKALPHPERFMVTHWLNPAAIMPLVEVGPCDATTPEYLQAMLDLLRRARKVPVVCKPRPGLIVPRLQTLIMNEAARMVDEGVGTAEEIDKAVKVGLGFRYLVLGLLEFTDFGGVDTLYYASRYLSREIGSDRFAAPPGVTERMEKGEIGLKSGQGYYDWRTPEMQQLDREARRRYLHLLKFMGLM